MALLVILWNSAQDNFIMAFFAEDTFEITALALNPIYVCM
jgi:hypothetical protein